jgi:hypothetical protein
VANATDYADILAALYTRLTGDSTFNTLLGGSASAAGRVWYGIAGERETSPYAAYEVVDNVPDLDTFDKDSYRMRVQISIFSHRRTDGPEDVGDIADALRERIMRVVLTVTDHEQLDMRVLQERGPFVDNEEWWRHDMDVEVAGWRDA